MINLGDKAKICLLVKALDKPTQNYSIRDNKYLKKIPFPRKFSFILEKFNLDCLETLSVFRHIIRLPFL